MSVVGLHHIHLRVNELEKSSAFLRDFGLVEVVETGGRVYFRGSGPAAYHIVLEAAAAPSVAALAFEVDEAEDLARAVREFGAGEPVELAGPGGGRAVTLTDPEGQTVQLVHGIARREADAEVPVMIYNQGQEKPRLGVVQRKAPLGPPPLLRLGHIGLYVQNWAQCDEWYRRVLGLIPSDLFYAKAPDNLIGGFYRVNRGAQWVDHHTLALFQMGKSDLHHVSFEVKNSEQQHMAHRWMAQKNHDLVWGVGRHPLGSHVFDVWRDPSGYRFETFSDTDMANADTPAGLHSIDGAEMDLWSDRDAAAYFI